MRIITRGDFDGFASSVLLSVVEEVDEIRFVHPKEAQDGQVQAEAEDIVVNLPYIPGCGLWFDHHISEEPSLPPHFRGRFEIAPSCARVIYNHYVATHAHRLAPFQDLLAAVDRLDSAQLTKEDVLHPSGWILLGMTLDPRTGLGPEFRKYFRWLVDMVKELPIEKVLAHPEVKRRTDRLFDEMEHFQRLLQRYARVEGNVIITDFRELKEKPVGNRFLVFTLFPEANVEMRLFEGLGGKTVVAVGHSIFNRTCRVNVGELLKKYGGGGHVGAGTVQFPPETAEEGIREILAHLKEER